MKNIAKNGVLLTFVALMGAQATAQVTVEKLTIQQILNSKIYIALEEYSMHGMNYDEIDATWTHAESSDFKLGVNIMPKSGSFSPVRGDEMPLIYYSKKSNVASNRPLALSSDSNVVKHLILSMAYKLHMGYEEAKARLSDSEGNMNLETLSALREKIQNSKTAYGTEVLEKKSKDVELSDLNKIDAINDILEQYTSAYDMASNAVAGVQIDDKHFIFQLPDRAIDNTEEIERVIQPARGIIRSDEEFNAFKGKLNSMTFKARDYIYVTLGDNEASHEAPEAWYNQELGGHLIVGGPAVAPKSMNISNGTPSSSSTGRNNNTKEEMEAEMREEKNKG